MSRRDPARSRGYQDAMGGKAIAGIIEHDQGKIAELNDKLEQYSNTVAKFSDKVQDRDDTIERLQKRIAKLETELRITQAALARATAGVPL